MLADDLTLYAVTDRHWLNGRTLADCVQQALAGGATMIQLREKHRDDAAFIQTARTLQPLCAQAHVPLIINDNLAVAQAVAADGLHIGQNDQAAVAVRAALQPHQLLGVSAQTVAEAVAAEAAGADYLGVGAVFATATKPDAVDVSLTTLAAITAAVSIPVVAIGGINETNLSQLAGRGIAGVALVSAIFAATDIQAQTAALRQQVAAVLA
ncbi:thiamine phosphate synthase [Lacticaseibacillus daqingensis]|uniref:thiamine phosphate synthase n=1 Tax=Lacticaseibacillus daqingensis TaxID=2486014 RepID=UPI000F793021|nr:thiamine phosphate synthase [Lacticaseibacillus daqingensis]